MHKLLMRQIRRCFGSAESVPPELRPLLELVDTAYRESDSDRLLLEHSMQTVSQELISRHRALREEEARSRALSEAKHVLEELQAAAALHDSEQRFSAIYNNAAVGINLTDAEGRFLQTNPAFQTFIGYTEEELVGRRSADFSPPEDAEITRAAMTDLRNAVRNVIVEKRFLQKNGTVVWGKLALSLVRSDAGELLYVVAVIEDITESHRVRGALKESEDRLRQSQKMEAVGQLAGGIAHDFNNLLTVIGGHTAMLLEEMPQSDAAFEDIAEIQKAANRAAELTRQLLAFSRRQVLQPKRVQLNAIIEGIVPMLRRLIGEDIEIECRLLPCLPDVLADPGQIEQVLMNLAVNARDAMPAGGTLTLATARSVRLEADSNETLQYVEVSVQDTGSGMSPDILQHVFEPFFTTKEPGKGTGLGLATVYGIVTQSGGQVNVSSIPGEGSTFRVHLPASGEAQSTVRRVETARKQATMTGTILLVEDDAAVRLLASRVLQRAGYRVIAAASPREALTIAADPNASFDMLLTDMVMPEMNGRELAEMITAGLPKLPVLYMSGYTDDDILRRGLSMKGAEYLQKPFAPNALVAAVSRLLAGVEGGPGPGS
jgi:two-component system cell cycle sensor histidine kinase/response regulator CckA